MPRSDNLRSILAMLLAVAFFSLMDTVLKLLSARYPALQVAALRGLTALPLVAVYVLWRSARLTGPWLQADSDGLSKPRRHNWWIRLLQQVVKRLAPVNWRLHLLRGVLSIGMLSLFAYALRELSLAAAYTVFFVAPLLITGLSGRFLGERVPPAHWWAVGFGMLGVVVAMRPDSGELLSWGALAVLGSAACYAVSAIASRVLSRTDTSDSMILSVMLMLGLGAGVLAWPNWVPVAASDAPLLLALATTGFLGQVAITAAFSRGQASAVAPFEYTALAWGIGLDWWLWSTWPDSATWLGGGIIVASGIYLLRREKIHAAVEHP
jgi:drug/metabolite transporter (DMT)-like permease